MIKKATSKYTLKKKSKNDMLLCKDIFILSCIGRCKWIHITHGVKKHNCDLAELWGKIDLLLNSPNTYN